MEEAQLSVQALAVAGAMAGGIVVLGNGVIRLAEKVIDSKRKNGNGNGSEIIHEDLKEVSEDTHKLLIHVEGFKRSHETLKELAIEQAQSNRKFHSQFAVFMEKFSAHMQDFKCLRNPGKE